jgi:arylformamidase
MDFFKTSYDISVKLGSESVDHPQATPYSRRLIWTLKNGNHCNLSEFLMTSHTGTHVDAPAHFVPHGKFIDQYSVEDFIFAAHVVTVEDRELIRSTHLEDIDIHRGEALLFRTYNSIDGLSRSGRFSKEYVAMSSDAAELCVVKGVGLVGIDYVTIDRYGDRSFAVHRKLLENSILILEGIDLSHVPEGKYTLLCPPINIEGGEAAPARAVLFT